MTAAFWRLVLAGIIAGAIASVVMEEAPPVRAPVAQAAARASLPCWLARRAMQHHLHRVHVGKCYWLGASVKYFGWPSRLAVDAHWKGGPTAGWACGRFFGFHRGFW